MSADTIKLPTYGELRAQLAVMTAERDALARQKERSDALIDTMRLLVKQVDPACAMGAAIDDRLATLLLMRRMILNAIQAWKE